MSISGVHRSVIYHIMSSLLLWLCYCEATTMWFSTLWPVFTENYYASEDFTLLTSSVETSFHKFSGKLVVQF